ncbi:LLM class F420-dependent oxidoreductase [Dactylosporangium sp. CS-047395]|uniref:LLM class F420-dependent oxidoreductase n=1 Tax=Dactylosporangium sp. CS-047395 TaxID=3239936 RepID=UPI003D912E06
MKLGMQLKYTGEVLGALDRLAEYESAGLDVVHVPEVYSYDAVSQLGYIAARTSRVEIASGILNVYTRTPALLAMTAAGLDAVSGGRFTLGLGSSGPQVVEGFHGVRYDAPVGRLREVVQICRQVWRREPLIFDGRHYTVPLTEPRAATGLGKPLWLVNRPRRARIPITLAALAPRGVALAAELCEGWEPAFYLPERAAEAFGEPLARGLARRAADLGPLRIVADTWAHVSDDPAELAAATATVRQIVALYVGGMGARGANYYAALMERYGFGRVAARIQDLYLAGQKPDAAALVPQELIDGIALIGPAAWVKDRVHAFAATGVGTLNATPVGRTHRQRLHTVEAIRGMLD